MHYPKDKDWIELYILLLLSIENDCCEDEIVKNGDDGFDAGDTIESKFENCAKFALAATFDNLTVKLTGWNELTVCL